MATTECDEQGKVSVLCPQRARARDGLDQRESDDRPGAANLGELSRSDSGAEDDFDTVPLTANSVAATATMMYPSAGRG
jgi:hypothetical protein